MSNGARPVNLEHLLAELTRIADMSGQVAASEAAAPAKRLFRELMQNTWNQCQEHLLPKTSILRVSPMPGPTPRVFQFEFDCPYKCKLMPSETAELVPGPVRGMIHYRADMFASPDLPYIAVQIDPTLGFFHPNCSRQRGSLLCIGEIPRSAFPFPLDLLLENHLYPIVTYQNRRPAHPFDEEAARYFALEPTAMHGLEPVQPLY